MSLSDGGAPTILTGRVILGSGQGGEAETTISELEARRSPMAARSPSRTASDSSE